MKCENCGAELGPGDRFCTECGQPGNVLSVAFAPDGRTFASGSGTDAIDADSIKNLGVDNTVRLWDTDSRRVLARFTGHQRNVLSVAISPDGRHVLSGSADGTVRLWAIPQTGTR